MTTAHANGVLFNLWYAGYAMTYPHGVSGAMMDPGKKLYADLVHLFQSLHAVTNNGPTSIGGGGVPRLPPKPPICGAPQ